MHWLWFFFPFIAALTGWLINSLLIKLLFRPLQPQKILGITIQGVFPKQQQSLAEKIGKFAGNGLLSSAGIEQKITNPENLDKVMPLIEQHIDEFLRVRLGKEMPVVSMFIGEKTISTMKTVFMKELAGIFPQVIKNFAGNLLSEINLEKIVTDKIASYPAAELEAAFIRHLSTEIRMIRIAGAITGFIIGLVQILLSLAAGN